jgi:hypothetical protein
MNERAVETCTTYKTTGNDPTDDNFPHRKRSLKKGGEPNKNDGQLNRCDKKQSTSSNMIPFTSISTEQSAEGINDHTLTGWVELQMHDMFQNRGIRNNQNVTNSSLTNTGTITNDTSSATTTYQEALKRLHELQELIEHEEMQLQPLQEQSDLWFDRLMYNNEENQNQYIEWRRRNGLEILVADRDEMTTPTQNSNPIALPAGIALAAAATKSISAFDKIVPQQSTTFCADNRRGDDESDLFAAEQALLGNFAL